MCLETCPGVYILHHKPTSKFYIGASRNIAKRLGTHKALQRSGTHGSTQLQKIYTS